METHNIHIVPTRNNGWAVAVEGTGGATSHYPSQAEAIAAGAMKAKRDKVELVIHGSDGAVQRTASFDPAIGP